jgi:hypothetical protein
MLDHVIGNWRSPKEMFLVERIGMLGTLIAARDTSHPVVWGLKAPRLCFAAPFMLPMLSNPRAIIIQRPFEDSVKSLMTRDHFPRAVAEHILARYEIALYGAASALNKAQVPHATLSYEYALQEPEVAIDGICEMLPYDPTMEQLEAALSHVRPELNHAPSQDT